jgi:hypothetical protein
VRKRNALELTTSARSFREAAAILDFEAAHSLKEIAKINATHGHVFRTASYVSGEPGAAYHRLITVRGHLHQAGRLGSGLRSLAARYDRRAAVRRSISRMSGRNS